ncbi:hypothetical protein LX97_01128 [Nonlabens dokdonensis]|uniref:Uncharacterized protein n=2 Tax=Nonlabens dokdonensis TaxID=328515 RepID=L7W8C3_NONDD|nr:hypothetical protein [Nonlabens dokdonensis]AGC76462.1 hypothetical protein DDD_1335 [Nonlabens dokdonensis DSW-6]PZX44119.1 hypothetical protein LX97_01128 [Nonlabens dokdonensis]
MKNIILLISIIVFLNSCDSDDNDCQGIDCLPPITQTGAGTFGCLVNGEPFVDNSGSFNCFYQLVDGEYFFNICGLDETGIVSDICLRTNQKEIGINQYLDIESNDVGNFFASIAVDDDGLRFFDSSSSTTGAITITEFIANSNVVSATFEFSVIDPNTGTLYNITNGRFDAIFTQ